MVTGDRLSTPLPKSGFGTDDTLEKAASGLARMTSRYNMSGSTPPSTPSSSSRARTFVGAYGESGTAIRDSHCRLLTKPPPPFLRMS